MQDGVNAILYDTEFRNGKFHLQNGSLLVEKIQYYLDNSEERKQMADRWAHDVRNGHTVYARSRYISESMEKAL